MDMGKMNRNAQISYRGAQIIARPGIHSGSTAIVLVG